MPSPTIASNEGGRMDFPWATIEWRSYARTYFSRSDMTDATGTALENYIAWEQVADVFTAR